MFATARAVVATDVGRHHGRGWRRGAATHIGATTYHDVSTTYHADGIDTDFTFGIRNLFDKQPPIAMSAFANSFQPTYCRAPGRFFYGHVGVKF